MGRTTLLGILALVGVLCVAGALIYDYRSDREHGGALRLPQPAPDFTLRTPDGAEFRLSQYRGEVVLVDFGYTFCPDVCPTALVELAQVRLRLGEAAKRVQVVFVTIDPERDTPERLRSYTAAFDPSFIGLTGSPAHLAQVRQAYGVVAEKQVVAGTSAAYLVAHSAYVYVIDPQGQLQGLFPFGMAVEDMAAQLERLLEG